MTRKDYASHRFLNDRGIPPSFSRRRERDLCGPGFGAPRREGTMAAWIGASRERRHAKRALGVAVVFLASSLGAVPARATASSPSAQRIEASNFALLGHLDL